MFCRVLHLQKVHVLYQNKHVKNHMKTRVFKKKQKKTNNKNVTQQKKALSIQNLNFSVYAHLSAETVGMGFYEHLLLIGFLDLKKHKKEWLLTMQLFSNQCTAKTIHTPHPWPDHP